jgi:hypothetical protein
MADPLHLIKLSVGTQDVADLARWHRDPRSHAPDGLPRHVTRMRPKRVEELLAGGSVYWVIRRMVQCRQRIVRLDEVRWDDGVPRCALVLDPELVRVAPRTKRPFQGWRYLPAADAPRDLGTWREGDEDLPPRLSAALAEIGVM